MADLNSLVIFASVVEANSFSEAARRLQMPVSTVSRRIAELEDQLGVRLLERSTRSLRLTEVGAEIFEHARRSAELGQAVDTIVSDKAASVSGALRLSAPPSISDSLLAPLVCAFQETYPNVYINIFITERFVDHIAEGVDLAFRLGPLGDSSLVARKLLTYRHQLVASPSYIEKYTLPTKPADLLEHRLLAFSYWKREKSWTFTNVKGRKSETITLRPYLSMNDFAGLVPALLAGIGVGELPPVVQPELMRSGRLVEIMPEWRFGTFDLSLVHLSARHVSKAVRVFTKFAIERAPALFPDLPA